MAAQTPIIPTFWSQDTPDPWQKSTAPGPTCHRSPHLCCPALITYSLKILTNLNKAWLKTQDFGFEKSRVLVALAKERNVEDITKINGFTAAEKRGCIPEAMTILLRHTIGEKKTFIMLKYLQPDFSMNPISARFHSRKQQRCQIPEMASLSTAYFPEVL